MPIKLLLFLLLFSSCNMTESKLGKFENYLYEALVFSEDIVSDDSLLDKEIVSPPGTWLNLVTIHESGKKKCLWYKTPFKNNKGTLKLSELCNDRYSKGEIELPNISKIEITFRENKFILKGNYVVDFEFSIPVYNSRVGRPKFKRFDSPVKNNAKMGIRYYRNENEIKNIEPVSGTLEDSFKDGKIIYCHRLNEKCEEVQPYRCGECRFGWYEVVDYKCHGGGSKLCGINRCGERGHPACLRGYQVTNEKRSKCNVNSRAGYCQKGLQKFCDSNGILTCL